MSRKQNLKTVQKQHDQFISKGGAPLMEFALPEDEFLIVNIEVHTENEGDQRFPLAVYFSGDFEKETFFSGDVGHLGDKFYILIDEYTENYDSYLEMIYNEISEGYLLPNDLYCD